VPHSVRFSWHFELAWDKGTAQGKLLQTVNICIQQTVNTVPEVEPLIVSSFFVGRIDNIVNVLFCVFVHVLQRRRDLGEQSREKEESSDGQPHLDNANGVCFWRLVYGFRWRRRQQQQRRAKVERTDISRTALRM
jgi:hypothetical protein